MKNLFSKISILVVFALISMNCIGQTQTATANHTLSLGIPEVCLLGTDAAPISLVLTTTTAGAQITGGAGTGYVQVASIVSPSETRTITASVTGVPAGTQLKVLTTAPSGGNSGGVLGTGSALTTLTNAAPAVTLASGIGSCYTGTASTDGFKMDYTWIAALGSYGSIQATTGSNATVVLTLTNIP